MHLTFIVGNNLVTATSTQPQTVNCTAYWYNIKDANYIYTVQENADSNKIYQMLCEDISIINPNGNNTNYTPYWLASRCIRSDTAGYAIHYIGDMHSGGNLQAELGIRTVYTRSGNTYIQENGVLPIVKLNTAVKLVCNHENECWEIDYSPETYTVSFNSNGGTGIHYSNKQKVRNLSTINGENVDLYATWVELNVGDYVNYNPASGEGIGFMYNNTQEEDIRLSGTFKSNENLRWRIHSINEK